MVSFSLATTSIRMGTQYTNTLQVILFDGFLLHIHYIGLKKTYRLDNAFLGMC